MGGTALPRLGSGGGLPGASPLRPSCVLLCGAGSEAAAPRSKGGLSGPQGQCTGTPIRLRVLADL